jgi:hypothetical protein
MWMRSQGFDVVDDKIAATGECEATVRALWALSANGFKLLLLPGFILI